MNRRPQRSEGPETAGYLKAIAAREELVCQRGNKALAMVSKWHRLGQDARSTPCDCFVWRMVEMIATYDISQSSAAILGEC